MSGDRIDRRARFDLIRYANCWEDADVLCDALQPAAGKRILSIASAGDNSFALLADGADVVAADLSRAQLHLVELKRAAIRHLKRAELLAFLGVDAHDDREGIYESIAGDLPSATREYWSDNSHLVRTGVIHSGKFERYFALFRERVLPFVHSRRDVAELLAPKDADARLRFYRKRWNNFRWRLMFRIFFSRTVMGRAGRDPEFFRYVEGSVADRIFRRAEYAMTVLPTDTNPYLTYIFTGNYGANVPRYLRENVLPRVRERLDRLELVHGSIDEAAARSEKAFDAFNLSDIFEYLDAPTCAALYASLLSRSNPGARFAYWNMLVPRYRPEELATRVERDEVESRRLFERDFAFFYRDFIVEVAR